jgi:hypothetical protein
LAAALGAPLPVRVAGPADARFAVVFAAVFARAVLPTPMRRSTLRSDVFIRGA